MKKQELDYIIKTKASSRRGLCFIWSQAQATFEYAIILAIAVTALTGMQVYFKRGIQAGIKICSDELGGQKEGLVDEDIEHGVISQASVQHTSTNSVQREQIANGEARQVNITDVSTRTGTTVSMPFSLQPVGQVQVPLVDPASVVTILNFTRPLSPVYPDPVDPIIFNPIDPVDPVVFNPDPRDPIIPRDPVIPRDPTIIDFPMRLQ